MAGRLRPLRAVLPPHDLARRGHLPDRRRPRRRGGRHAAVCAPQQLARQHQSRQGAPAPLADQAEVRPEDFLGRSPRAHRQRGAGIDGPCDLRLRRRPNRCLGARRNLLGAGEDLAWGRTLQRRSAARQSARRRPDGPDLRQSGRAQRRARSGRFSPRHPRDVRPDGDERRRDRRPRGRRPHLRQDPRRCRREPCRPRAGGSAPRSTGPRLEK